MQVRQAREEHGWDGCGVGVTRGWQVNEYHSPKLIFSCCMPVNMQTRFCGAKLLGAKLPPSPALTPPTTK